MDNAEQPRKVYVPYRTDAGWTFLDKDGSEIGPFETEDVASWKATFVMHEDNGWRPPCPPSLEAMLQRQWSLEDEIASITEALNAKKAELKNLGEVELPEVLMTARDVEDVDFEEKGVRLADGREFDFERKMHCGIPAQSRELAHQWLAANGADAILKNTVTLRFGKNAYEDAKRLKAAIAAILPQYEISVRVGKAPAALLDAVKELVARANLSPTIEHDTELPGSTLGAYVRKQMKLGKTLPDFLGVYAPVRAVLVTTDIGGDLSPLLEASLAQNGEHTEYTAEGARAQGVL